MHQKSERTGNVSERSINDRHRFAMLMPEDPHCNPGIIFLSFFTQAAVLPSVNNTGILVSTHSSSSLLHSSQTLPARLHPRVLPPSPDSVFPAPSCPRRERRPHLSAPTRPPVGPRAGVQSAAPHELAMPGAVEMRDRRRQIVHC